MTRNRIALMAARDALREAHRDLRRVEHEWQHGGAPTPTSTRMAEQARRVRVNVWLAYEAACAALEGDEGRG